MLIDFCLEKVSIPLHVSLIKENAAVRKGDISLLINDVKVAFLDANNYGKLVCYRLSDENVTKLRKAGIVIVNSQLVIG